VTLAEGGEEAIDSESDKNSLTAVNGKFAAFHWLVLNFSSAAAERHHV
jgi:hypothetical protein